jgi:hypothetical protein
VIAAVKDKRDANPRLAPRQDQTLRQTRKALTANVVNLVVGAAIGNGKERGYLKVCKRDANCLAGHVTVTNSPPSVFQRVKTRAHWQ